MAKKTITKTVNRTGKSLVKKALVVSNKKSKAPNAEEIKKMNEALAARQEAAKKPEKEVKKEDRKDEVKPDKIYELTIDLKDLLEAGSHLGHKVSKTHPKAKENIYMAKDGIQIIDLTKTYEALKKACNFIYNARRNGKQIVMIGTKRQAREVVRRVATEAGVPYITDRWLGGTITNWDQVRKSIKRMLDLKEGLEKGTFTDYTKKEQLEMHKEMLRLQKIIGGLATLEKIFDIIFVVDAGFEKTAIREASLRGIKTVAIADTDTNQKKVDFAIPANDDNNKSITLIVEEIGKAIKSAGVNSK